MIHGAIDGFSRLVLYLHCCNNNKAVTVLKLFKEAVKQYSIPSRVRSDQGLENIEVAKFMLLNRGLERSSVLVGASVHNQRIERLWRDVFLAVTQLYHRLFHYMERCELLNPLNAVHLYALHFVFIPRINKALESFINGWNNHCISKTAGYTPIKLFTKGMIQQHFADTNVVTDDYGVDDEDSDLIVTPVPDSIGVNVPHIGIGLPENCIEILNSRIDPVADSEQYGIDIYVNTLSAVEELLEQ